MIQGDRAIDERQDGYINREGWGDQIEGEIQVHTLPSEFVGQGKGGYQRCKAQMSSSDLAGVKKRNFFLV